MIVRLKFTRQRESTPLYFAAQNGHTAVAHLLLLASASADARSDVSLTLRSRAQLLTAPALMIVLISFGTSSSTTLNIPRRATTEMSCKCASEAPQAQMLPRAAGLSQTEWPGSQ